VQGAFGVMDRAKLIRHRFPRCVGRCDRSAQAPLACLSMSNLHPRYSGRQDTVRTFSLRRSETTGDNPCRSVPGSDRLKSESRAYSADALREAQFSLARKQSLTYIGCMVVIPNREPDVFAAISHPARRRMLDLLIETARSVNALAGHFQMSRPALSQHLRVLLDAGLVTEQRHGRERRYRLVPAQLRPVRDWMAYYEQFWDEHRNTSRQMEK
jgi:DNA-binding transcriptional ArsR family regulator